jgi:PAT family beta-lactamase induction signal transducer AmpG
MMNKKKAFNLSQKELTLSKNPVLRYLSFSALYLAQGLTDGTCLFTIPAWLAMNGKSATEIGVFIAISGLPWSFKIILAPIIDRYTILSMGRKRPWIIFGQLGLILSFLSIGLIPDPLDNMLGLTISGFFIGFFGAFQDVATDGLVVDIVPENEKARANGLMWGTKTIGISLALFVGTSLINIIGFPYAIASLSIATAFIILIPICFRERPGEKYFPWSKGRVSKESASVQVRSWKAILKSVYKVIKLPSVLLMILICFFFGVLAGFYDTLLSVFTIQGLGWTNDYYSNVFSITSLFAGIFGMFVGGPLVDFFGSKKMLKTYFLLLSLCIVTFAFLDSFWENNVIIFSFFMIMQLLMVFSIIGIFSASMKLSWKLIAATQFTLFMAVSNIGRSMGSGTVGILESMMSWKFVILSSAIWPLLIIPLVHNINFKKNEKLILNLITK